MIIKTYPDSKFAKVAKAYLRITDEYYKKGKEPSLNEIEKIFEEEGIKEGVIK